MIDLSKVRFRASSIGSLMGYPDGKSNQEKYDETYAAIIDTENKLLAMKDKECKTALLRTEKIETLQAALADIEPRIGNEELSAKCKHYLERIYFKIKYHKKSISEHYQPKQLAKGRIAEMDSIALISELDGIQYSKSTARLQNDYIAGAPDLFLGDDIYNADYVIEVKTSWDAASFYKHLKTQMATDYGWQIQAYMWLTNANQGEISFCLVNAPEYLINEEKKHLMFKMGVKSKKDPYFIKAAEKLVRDMTFDDIPMRERRIRFVVERDEQSIARISKRLDACREYLLELDKTYMNFFYQTPTIGLL